MNNIMLDLETMDNKPTAAIVAIGAVKFDNSGLGEEFYRVVSLESSMRAGLSISADTILWWLKQSEEARQIFNYEEGVRYNLHSILCDFSQFFIGFEYDKKVKIWGNGSDFDNTILANAYRASKLALPWKFYNNRCYRTIKNMHRDIKLKRVGTHHNALDDAKSQALHLIEITKIKGLRL